ncbi:alpha/beta hydrolase, partial [Saccharopolyspora sp. WRP15-2]
SDSNTSRNAWSSPATNSYSAPIAARTRSLLSEAVAEFEERDGLPWAGPALGRTTVELLRSWLVPPARSLWRLLPEIGAPTLVVWGAQDRVVSVRKAPRTALLIPRGKLLVLPRTGHVAQMERPRIVARAVLGLVESDNW